MPGDFTASTYDQAIAIIAYLGAGDVARARRCADAMLGLRDAGRRAWVDAYDSRTAGVKSAPCAVGPNAWMGLALLHLHHVTRDDQHLRAAEAVATFVQSLQAQDGPQAGSVRGGYGADGTPFEWTSTEHNADAVAFLAGLAKVTGRQDYQTAASQVAAWLNREMWAPAGHYDPGYEDTARGVISRFPEQLDSQTWTILGQHAASQLPGWTGDSGVLSRNGLAWIDQHRCDVEYGGESLTGYAKITLGPRARKSIWTEGTAGYILAARRLNHSLVALPNLLHSLRQLQRSDGSVPYAVGVSFPDAAAQFAPADIVVAHFEGHPNVLLGQVAVHGDAEPNWDAVKRAEYRQPYSWYYEPDKPGYDRANIHSGTQSFRAVSAGAMCASRNKGWASLGLDLGPPIDEAGKIKPLDVSHCTELAFWARTDNRDGARVEVVFRDALAADYLPQASVSPEPSRLDGTWRRFRVPLRQIRGRVDIRRLVHVGLELGAKMKNPPGTVIYLDDVAFVAASGATAPTAHDRMPAVFPQHWPYGSVAGTAWLLFVELDMNPFAAP